MLADDGHHYVVKFRNNPQHPRILINELLSYTILQYLELPVPDWEFVDVPEELVAETPELTIGDGLRQRACKPGLHFGSKYVSNPDDRAVHDHLPLSLLWGVHNLGAFHGILAFDKWVSNADGRQAIFYRQQNSKNTAFQAYSAMMIDHGFAFDAQNWQFIDAPERGLYARREVYKTVTGYASFEPWLSRIRDCPTKVLDDAYIQTPSDWLDSDWNTLEALIDNLYTRRRFVPDLIFEARRAARDPFPNWCPRPV